MAKRAWIGNFKGPKGDKGNQGPQGIQGIPGPAGPAGTVDGNTLIDFDEATTPDNIESGESISIIFGKLKKIAGSLLVGAGSTLLGKDLTASRALISNGNGKIAVSPITSIELSHLSGLTEDVQVQFDELTGNLGLSVAFDTEVKTNDTVDGKPVYTKYISAICQQGQHDINHGITNVKNIWIDCQNSFFYDNNSKRFYPPSFYFHSNSIGGVMWTSGSQMTYYVNFPDHSISYHCVVRYTKSN